jgi:uncharacterized glyoxalase superfamily protein PhnB
MPTVERLTPILVYEDISRAHDFLVEAFGFASRGVEHDGEGNSVHAEVYVGDFAIWLHRVAPEHHMLAARSFRGATGGLYVHVADVDAHYERARALGVEIESELRDQPYGTRDYGVKDLEGHRWWFGSASKPQD